jgi:hypothetical protein
MDNIEGLINDAVKSHVLIPEGAPKSNVEITKHNYSNYGEAATVPLKDITANLKTNLKFKLTVFTYTANSVGQGFYHSADTSKPTGRKALDLIDDFADTWDLDSMNQKIGIDVWGGGNTFLNAVPSRENPIAALYHLPQSMFTHIERDTQGEVVNYKRSWGSQVVNADTDPDSILHWAWLPFDEEAFGEGIGQALARKGLGYETENGTVVQRESWFEAAEKMDDVSSKMVYAGLPRYHANFKGEGADADFVTDVNNQLNKLDPLQHIVTNVEGQIQTVALDTTSRFDSFMRHFDDQMVHGTMSPLIRLWSSLNFTFASSKEAVDAMLPLVSMYQRAHKRFLEKMVYEPIMRANNIDVKKADLHLNWGKQEKLTLEEIKQVFDMLKDPAFIDKFNADDFITMLQDAGVPLSKVNDTATTTLNDLRNLIGRSDNNKTIKMRLQKPTNNDPLKAKKMKLYEALVKKYAK